jgi:RNA 2',3'-cyclic 3'-phosphodiesterase
MAAARRMAISPQLLLPNLMHDIGDYRRLPTKLTYAALRAGETVSMHPFEVTFSFITSFERAVPMDNTSRRRPLVLLGEGDALFELHKFGN